MTCYRSAFANWERTAAVRCFQMADLDWSAEGRWTPGGQFALIDHPAIPGLLAGPAGAALILGHFHFTTRLENELIARVCSRLASRSLIDHAQFAEDALKLHCDESFHALLCLELAAKVREIARIDQPCFGEPRFLRRVCELRARLAGTVAPEDVDLAAAVVAETIVTRTLGEDWRDPAVRDPIRAFLKAHHLDEARHGAFFTQTLALAWTAWDERTRMAIAAAWDGLVEAFAAPDVEMISTALTAGGVEAAVTVEILRLLRTQSERLAATADTRLTQRTLVRAQATAKPGAAGR